MSKLNNQERFEILKKVFSKHISENHWEQKSTGTSYSLGKYEGMRDFIQDYYKEITK